MVVLLVFTVCQTLPDLIAIIKQSKNKQDEDDTEETCTILYLVSNIASALIYVYHFEDIRRFLIQKFFSMIPPVDRKEETTPLVPKVDEKNEATPLCPKRSNLMVSRYNVVTLQEVLYHVTENGTNRRLFTITTQV